MNAPVDRLLAAAVEHHRQGRLVEARDGYLAVLGQQPDHPDALHLFGRLFLDAGHFDEAAKLIGRAVEVSPDFPEARVGLGDALRGLGRLQDAVAHYEAVSEESDLYIQAQVSLGLTWVALGKAPEAERAFRRCLAKQPGLPEAHGGLGDALNLAGQREAAMAAWRAAVEAAPDDPRFRLRLGTALEEDGALADAVEQFTGAHSIAPESADAYAHLVAALARSLSDDPTDADARRRAEELCSEPVPAGSGTTDARALLDAALGRTGGGRVFAIGLLEAADHPFRDIDGPVAGRVYEFEDATVANRLWYVLAGGVLHPDLHAHMPEDLDVPSVRLLSAGLAVADGERPRTRFTGPAVLIGGCGNYYHWLVDHLPLLALVAGCPDLAGVPLIVNPDLRPFQRESLAALGIPAERLLSFADADFIDAEKLIVPLIPGRRGTDWGAAGWWWRPTLTAPVHAWLRAAFGVENGPDGGRRLFLSRAGAGSRRAANEAEIAGIAAGLGYEVVDPAAMSFAEQVDCFTAASHIAGVHGAGFANALFAPRGARLIEFVGEGTAPEFYRHLAALGGLGFTRVDCAVTDAGSTDFPGDRRYNDILIDRDAARAALA